MRLHGFAVSEEDVGGQVLAEKSQSFAERAARLGIRDVAPEEGGEFFAGMGFGMESEKGEE